VDLGLSHRRAALISSGSHQILEKLHDVACPVSSLVRSATQTDVSVRRLFAALQSE